MKLVKGDIKFETVEEFLARGGVVKRYPCAPASAPDPDKPHTIPLPKGIDDLIRLMQSGVEDDD